MTLDSVPYSKTISSFHSEIVTLCPTCYDYPHDEIPPDYDLAHKYVNDDTPGARKRIPLCAFTKTAEDNDSDHDDMEVSDDEDNEDNEDNEDKEDDEWISVEEGRGKKKERKNEKATRDVDTVNEAIAVRPLPALTSAEAKAVDDIVQQLLQVTKYAAPAPWKPYAAIAHPCARENTPADLRDPRSFHTPFPVVASVTIPTDDRDRLRADSPPYVPSSLPPTPSPGPTYSTTDDPITFYPPPYDWDADTRFTANISHQLGIESARALANEMTKAIATWRIDRPTYMTAKASLDRINVHARLLRARTHSLFLDSIGAAGLRQETIDLLTVLHQWSQVSQLGDLMDYLAHKISRGQEIQLATGQPLPNAGPQTTLDKMWLLYTHWDHPVLHPVERITACGLDYLIRGHWIESDAAHTVVQSALYTIQASKDIVKGHPNIARDLQKRKYGDEWTSKIVDLRWDCTYTPFNELHAFC